MRAVTFGKRFHDVRDVRALPVQVFSSSRRLAEIRNLLSIIVSSMSMRLSRRRACTASSLSRRYPACGPAPIRCVRCHNSKEAQTSEIGVVELLAEPPSRFVIICLEPLSRLAAVFGIDETDAIALIVGYAVATDMAFPNRRIAGRQIISTFSPRNPPAKDRFVELSRALPDRSPLRNTELKKRPSIGPLCRFAGGLLL
jgi:hypothetical protein